MKTALGVVALSLLGGVAAAGPVDVTFSVSGTPGAWVLDFNVVNNLNPATMDVYFFGVELGARNIVDSPPPYDPNLNISWNNFPYGGSDTTYDNVWTDGTSTFVTLLPGQHLSGFKALVTSVDVPSEVKFFAFGWALGEAYSGTDYFSSPYNPGFEGVATVPAPASLGVIGLAGVFASRRRR